MSTFLSIYVKWVSANPPYVTIYSSRWLLTHYVHIHSSELTCVINFYYCLVSNLLVVIYKCYVGKRFVYYNCFLLARIILSNPCLMGDMLAVIYECFAYTNTWVVRQLEERRLLYELNNRQGVLNTPGRKCEHTTNMTIERLKQLL